MKNNATCGECKHCDKYVPTSPTLSACKVRAFYPVTLFKSACEKFEETPQYSSGVGCTEFLRFIAIIVMVIAAFGFLIIGIASWTGEQDKRARKEEWLLNERIIQRIKSSEEIFKIDNKDRKIYKVNSVEDVSKINNLVGLKNDQQTGFYPCTKFGDRYMKDGTNYGGNELYIGIRLLERSYPCSTAEKDMTTATFKWGDLSFTFEEAVRLKLFKNEPNNEKIKQIIQEEKIKMKNEQKDNK